MNDKLQGRIVQPDKYGGAQNITDIGFWCEKLQDVFGWKVALDFTLAELQAIYQAGSQILSYVNGITGGKSTAWMNKYLGGTRFVHGEFPRTHHSFVTGTTVRVTPAWQGGNWTHIVHELGHVYDDNSGGFFWAAIFGGGNADRLQKAIGGHPAGVRFYNGTAGVPVAYRWPQGSYGNVATAEYFAEVFMYAIYNPGQVPGPLDSKRQRYVVDILQGFIAKEASDLHL